MTLLGCYEEPISAYRALKALKYESDNKELKEALESCQNTLNMSLNDSGLGDFAQNKKKVSLF